jgi:hypothetical protein
MRSVPLWQFILNKFKLLIIRLTRQLKAENWQHQFFYWRLDSAFITTKIVRID